MAQGSAISAWTCGSRQVASRSCQGLPADSTSLSSARRPRRAVGPSAMKRFSSPAASGASQRAICNCQPPAAKARCRSSTWSPMATPMRSGSSLPARRNRPKGRFWIGKSLAPSLALATQLRSAGSCVASSPTLTPSPPAPA